MNVAEAMTRSVRTIDMDSTLDEAAKLMWSADCGSLPVVNGSGTVVAMLTDRDICMHAWTQGRALSELRVHGAMSGNVVCCHPADAVDHAERLMQQYQIRRLPVVDDHGRPVGILSMSDLSREAESNSSGHGLAPWELVHTLAAVSRPHGGRHMELEAAR